MFPASTVNRLKSCRRHKYARVRTLSAIGTLRIAGVSWLSITMFNNAAAGPVTVTAGMVLLVLVNRTPPGIWLGVVFGALNGCVLGGSNPPRPSAPRHKFCARFAPVPQCPLLFVVAVLMRHELAPFTL